MKKVKNNAAPVGFLLLFGLAFLAAGLAAGLVPMVKTLQDWSRMQAWERAPGRVLSTDLIERHGDSTTYRVEARYEYDYRGQRYVGERVGLDTAGGDNIGNWQRDMHARLRAAQAQGGFMVWVDPADPAESVVDREIRWALFVFRVPFALVFTGVGVASLFGARYLRNREREAPGAAWWQRERAWRNGRVVSRGRAAMWGAWGFAAFWDGVVFPMLFLAREEAGKEPMLAVILAVFLLAGVWLLWRAARLTLEWSRFKELALVMTPFPAAAGAPLAATLDIPSAPPNTGRFRARLTCRHLSRGHKNTRESAVWQQEVEPQVERVGRGVRLAMRFTPPAGLPESSEPSRDYHVWSIDVTGNLPGVDLERRFDVPVLASTAPAVEASTAPFAPAAAVSTRVDLTGKPFRIERTAGGTRIDYLPARHRLAGVALFVFGLIFSGASAFMIHEFLGAGFMVAMLGFMAVVFLGTSAALMLGGLALMTYRLSVDVGPAEVLVTRRFAGFPRIRRLLRTDIVAVDVVVSGSQKTGDRIEVFYGLKARLRDGRSAGIGDGIRGADVADALAGATAAALGLPPEQIGAAAAEARSEPPAALADPAARARFQRWAKLLGRIGGLVFFASLAWEFRAVLAHLF